MSRDLKDLVPKVREQALQLQKLALDKLGLRIIFTQTRRTEKEQQALYSQGRNTLEVTNEMRKFANMPLITDAENRMIVTKAKSVADSMHGYGLAFDIAVVDQTGKKIGWNHSDWNGDNINDWDQVGRLADEIGLEWGGNWSGMCDPPHYQNRMGLTLAQLKAGVPIPS